MYLLVPANSTQLIDRALWFKNPIARKLADKKNIEFGFELKGEPETIKKAPPLYWGYHIPKFFATEWYYHPEKRQELLSRLSNIASLKPSYVNMHGIHLWWQPSLASESHVSRGGASSREYIHRYTNRSEPEEYLKVLNSNIELIKKLKKILKDAPLTLENYPLYQYYLRDNKYIPETYLYTGTGRLNDLLYLKEKTGVEVLLDLEHLILTLNFLNRERNYSDLPIKKIANPNKEMLEIFGFVLEKDVIPYVQEKVKLADTVKKIGAKKYHVTGSVQDVIPGKRFLTHEAIEVDDKVFSKNLGMVLAQKPETILVETASSTDDPCFSHHRPNETELSFYHLCEILLEEL